MTALPGRSRAGESPRWYTLVLCGASRCVSELHDHALSAMRRVVRSSKLGVLVVARCPVGRLACGMRPPGPIVVVQPSDARQRPTTPAVRVGPLLTVEDVEIAEAWLREARLVRGCGRPRRGARAGFHRSPADAGARSRLIGSRPSVACAVTGSAIERRRSGARTRCACRRPRPRRWGPRWPRSVTAGAGRRVRDGVRCARVQRHRRCLR